MPPPTSQACLAKLEMAEIIAVNAGLPLSSTLNATVPVPQDVSTVAAAAAPAPLSSEDYLFVETRHPNTVLQGLNSLRLNNAFCDVTLCCGGQEFPCHRIVLASFSSYFQVKAGFLTVTPVKSSSQVYMLQKLCHFPDFHLHRQCFPLT